MAEPTPEPTPEALTAVLIRNANVRTGPGTDHAVAYWLTAGDTVTVVGRNADGDWLRIEHADRPGWIAAALADLTAEEMTQPPADALATESPVEPTPEPVSAEPTPEPEPVAPEPTPETAEPTPDMPARTGTFPARDGDGQRRQRAHRNLAPTIPSTAKSGLETHCRSRAATPMAAGCSSRIPTTRRADSGSTRR